MAWENDSNTFSLATTTTGLARHRFVYLSTAGVLNYPNASTVAIYPPIGVLKIGSTHSTRVPATVSVQHAGVAKVIAATTAPSLGDLVSASTLGMADTNSTNAGDYLCGRVVGVDGASTSTGQVVSVLLAHIGTSAASTSLG